MQIEKVRAALAADHIVPGVITVASGGRRRTLNSLRDAIFPQQAINLHAKASESSALVVIYSDVQVGCRSIIFQNNKPLFVAEVVPSYVRNWISIGDYECANLAARTEIHVDKAYHLLNVMYHGYGHFITEMMAKIFIIKDLYEEGFRWPIVLIDQAPDYIKEIINMILPSAAFIAYNPETHYLKCSTLVGISPYQNTILHMSLQSRIWSLASRSAREGSRRLFVRRRSRSGDFRNFVNEEEICNCALQMGFEPIYPGEMTLEDQLGYFWNAEFVIGEFGSALHNTIFSPPDTKVLSLNIGNIVQSSIALACGHRLGYLMGQDGQPRLSPSIKAERGGEASFSVSRDQFAKLVEANL